MASTRRPATYGRSRRPVIAYEFLSSSSPAAEDGEDGRAFKHERGGDRGSQVERRSHEERRSKDEKRKRDEGASKDERRSKDERENRDEEGNRDERGRICERGGKDEKRSKDARKPDPPPSLNPHRPNSPSESSKKNEPAKSTDQKTQPARKPTSGPKQPAKKSAQNVVGPRSHAALAELAPNLLTRAPRQTESRTCSSMSSARKLDMTAAIDRGGKCSEKPANKPWEVSSPAAALVESAASEVEGVALQRRHESPRIDIAADSLARLHLRSEEPLRDVGFPDEVESTIQMTPRASAAPRLQQIRARRAVQHPLATSDPYNRASKTHARSSTGQNAALVDHPPRHIASGSADINPKQSAHLAPLLACSAISPSAILPFESWLAARTNRLSISKIGDGTFGEVFRIAAVPSSTSSTSASNIASKTTRTAILKLLPIAPASGLNARSLTSPTAAAAELRLLARMQRVPGFVQFRGACVVCGRMPDVLVQAWLTYREEKRAARAARRHRKLHSTVHDDDPDSNDYDDDDTGVGGRDPRRHGRGGYAGSEQLWCVVEMGDAGMSLENWLRDGNIGLATWGEKGSIIAVERAWDVVWQVARALARGEAYAAFEHRDLHLGNLCVQEADEEPRDGGGEERKSSKLDDTVLLRHAQRSGLEEHDRSACSPLSSSTAASVVPPFSLRNSRLDATLIDYSLSRARVAGGSVVAYDFLGDTALQRGQGALQYEMYRSVAAVLAEKPLEANEPGAPGSREARKRRAEETEARSREFRPETNVLWLWFLVQSMLGTGDWRMVQSVDVEVSWRLQRAEAMVAILRDIELALRPERRQDWSCRSVAEVWAWGVESGWVLADENEAA